MSDDGLDVPPSGAESSFAGPSFARTFIFCGNVRPIAANFVECAFQRRIYLQENERIYIVSQVLSVIRLRPPQ